MRLEAIRDNSIAIEFTNPLDTPLRKTANQGDFRNFDYAHARESVALSAELARVSDANRRAFEGRASSLVKWRTG